MSLAEQDPSPQVQQRPLELLLEPGASLVHMTCVMVSPNLEDIFWGWHLQDQVPVMSHHHKLVQSWSTQNSV
jgi:hypothetical protein